VAASAFYRKCFNNTDIETQDQTILNQINVGIVFTVDDQIIDKLEIRANI
jgi:hypothetical protein